MHLLLRISRQLNAPTVDRVLQQSTNLVFVRHANNKAFAMNRQCRTMNKLLAGKKKSKKYWSIDDAVPKLPSIADLSSPTSQGKSSTRRVHVLNKLFMRHITDYMATDSKFAGYGLEISRVNITCDFKLVNVYWLARGDSSDETLEAVLSKSAGMLRHNLSQLRLMGEVPVIKFVKDRFYAKIAEVDRLLKVADFGDDYAPSTPSQMVRNELSGNDIQQLDKEFPEMTHTVLGLNQAEIMNRIKQNMTKSKQAWEKYETELPASLTDKYARGGEEKKDAIIRLREEEFQAFLSQRVRRNRKERRTQPNLEDDDNEEDDTNLNDEKDTYFEDFEIEKK